jgi:hypothetical protein
MSISAKAVSFDEHTMWGELSDGRSLGVPLAWFPRLLHATLEQRAQYYISYSGNGLHWDALDIEASPQQRVAFLLTNVPSPTISGTGILNLTRRHSIYRRKHAGDVRPKIRHAIGLRMNHHNAER